MKIITQNYLLNNFPEIHRHIKEYYPLGIKSSSLEYKNFSGIKKLEKLINTNIVNTDYYEKFWTNGFLKKISEITGYDASGATYGIVPNYGGKIIIKETEKYKIELQFYLSLIGNYYSVQIIKIDKKYNSTIFNNIPKFGPKIIKIIVSPKEGYYSELFSEIELLIENQFSKSKFLPYYFDTKKLNGLDVFHEYSTDLCDPISKAFFNKGINTDENVEIIGNINHKLSKL